jgi:hypothetical protein
MPVVTFTVRRGLSATGMLSPTFAGELFGSG